MTTLETRPPNPALDVFARPQTWVKISLRRRLNLRVTGEGSPSVLLGAGWGGWSLSWHSVQRRLDGVGRVVSYDRAGVGFSDPGPNPRVTSRIVADLRAALRSAGIAPPYVVVGHSLGGFEARLFAFLHPDEVAGMVLVDSSSAHQGRRFNREAPGSRLTWARQLAQLRFCEACTRNGGLAPGTPEYELCVGQPDPRLTDAVNAAIRDQTLRPSYWRSMLSEVTAMTGPSSDELVAARRPLDIPLIVLAAGVATADPRLSEADNAAMRSVWLEMQRDLAGLSSRGELRLVEGAGHNIQFDKPQAVADAIAEVVAAVRRGS